MTNNMQRNLQKAMTCSVAGILMWCGDGARPALAAQKVASDAAASVEQATPSEAEIDAQRGAFDRFLDAHPEIESDVVWDPRRIRDPQYIQDHPEIQAFLESHPLVKADPRAFVSAGSFRILQRRSSTEEMLGWFIPFSVFICIMLTAIWMLRTFLENRRWSRTFKVHEDLHSKLVDKFGTGPELISYMESDAGRRLLEWTPPALEGRMPFAAGRIMLSLQAGLIMGLAGAGLLEIRGYVAEAAEPLLVFGTLALTIGIGFCLSAILSYGISKHLGLLGNGVQDDAKPGLAPMGR